MDPANSGVVGGYQKEIKLLRNLSDEKRLKEMVGLWLDSENR